MSILNLILAKWFKFRGLSLLVVSLTLCKCFFVFVLFLFFTCESMDNCGRNGSLRVSALDSRSNGPDSSPGRGGLCCVLGQDTLLSLDSLLST